jgi:hypothetical protein
MSIDSISAMIAITTKSSISVKPFRLCMTVLLLFFVEGSSKPTTYAGDDDSRWYAYLW